MWVKTKYSPKMMLIIDYLYQLIEIYLFHFDVTSYKLLLLIIIAVLKKILMVKHTLPMNKRLGNTYKYKYFFIIYGMYLFTIKILL